MLPNNIISLGINFTIRLYVVDVPINLTFAYRSLNGVIFLGIVMNGSLIVKSHLLKKELEPRTVHRNQPQVKIRVSIPADL